MNTDFVAGLNRNDAKGHVEKSSEFSTIVKISEMDKKAVETIPIKLLSKSQCNKALAITVGTKTKQLFLPCLFSLCVCANTLISHKMWKI